MRLKTLEINVTNILVMFIVKSAFFLKRLGYSILKYVPIMLVIIAFFICIYFLGVGVGWYKTLDDFLFEFKLVIISTFLTAFVIDFFKTEQSRLQKSNTVKLFCQNTINLKVNLETFLESNLNFSRGPEDYYWDKDGLIISNLGIDYLNNSFNKYHTNKEFWFETINESKEDAEDALDNDENPINSIPQPLCRNDTLNNLVKSLFQWIKDLYIIGASYFDKRTLAKLLDLKTYIDHLDVINYPIDWSKVVGKKNPMPTLLLISEKIINILGKSREELIIDKIMLYIFKDEIGE